MRTMFAIAVTVALSISAGTAIAAGTAQQGTMKSCAASWKSVSATDKAKTKYRDYMSTCMKSTPKTTAALKPAAAPAMPHAAMPHTAVAAKASGQAKCKDGKVVSYKNRRGTCSGHGGVAVWM